MKNKNSIVMKTIYRVLSVSILAFLTLMIISTAYTSIYMRNKITESQREQLQHEIDTISNQFNGLIECMIALSEYTPANRLITSYYELYTPKWLECIRKVDDYLESMNMFTEYLVDVALLDQEAETVYSLNDILKSDYPYADQTWFIDAMQQESQVKYGIADEKKHLYKKYDGKTFCMIYPVYGAAEIKGYILMECELDKMMRIFLKQDSLSNYMLLNHRGEEIRSTQSLDLEQEEREKILLTQSKDSLYQNQEYYFLLGTIPVNQWKLVLCIDRGKLMFPVYRLILVMGMIGAGIIVFLSLVAVTSGKKMENAFLALISRIRSYEGGKPESVEEYRDAPYEIVTIADSFEEMAEKMNHLIEEVYLMNISQKEAELEALINQINPHFLYNVFQLIQTKAILADNREIEDMIQSLSMMLRYTMERKKEHVCIQDELTYIQNYLRFYKDRFPKLFEYEIFCEPQYLEIPVIKFILQPVVENCFKHAFTERKSGYHVTIRVEIQEDAVCFMVEDNGVGIEGERLFEIQKKLAEDHSVGGIGIVNTNERIQLCYGEPYGICIESVVREFTRVTIRCGRELRKDV